MSEKGIGIALSGGGFRATLFNLGSLWRLNELGLLTRARRITSVSGGSITAGVLALRWRELAFAGGVATNFEAQVAQPLRRFCRQGVDISAGLEGLVSIIDSVSDRVMERYREALFGDATLQDLPAQTDGAPRFVFYATSLQTGASVRLSRPYLADYRIGMLPEPRLALALAVAASSAFPPVLSPVVIETDPALWQRTEGADLYDHRALRERLVLTDGGVYDNMGLESVWERFETVLVSDAGKPLEVEESPSAIWHKQTLRVLDIVTEQTRALRKRYLVEGLRGGARRGAYWGITTRIGDYGLPDALAVDNDLTRSLRHLRTRLNPFSEKEQGQLINWGYALADAALRRHLPDPAYPPGRWPVPECAL